MSAAGWREQGVVFDSAGQRLVGILALPDAPADSAVLITVGGPQYRVGSHRQFTLLARELAAQGIASLRFDYTGMGDAQATPGVMMLGLPVLISGRAVFLKMLGPEAEVAAQRDNFLAFAASLTLDGDVK